MKYETSMSKIQSSGCDTYMKKNGSINNCMGVCADDSKVSNEIVIDNYAGIWTVVLP